MNKDLIIKCVIFLLGWQFGTCCLMGEQARNLGHKAGKFVKNCIINMRK